MAQLNIKKIQLKSLKLHLLLLKTEIVGRLENPLGEAVLTITHNYVLKKNIRNTHPSSAM